MNDVNLILKRVIYLYHQVGYVNNHSNWASKLLQTISKKLLFIKPLKHRIIIVYK